MELYYPAYYHNFKCLAGSCPDSCCHEWTIGIDADTAAFYRSLSGDLGDRLRSVLLDTEDGTVMQNENSNCPMWRPDGLCRIHAELGHDALCQTCRDFPRLQHDYGDFMELGLELSCPEAARLILEENGHSFLKETFPGDTHPDYDTVCMRTLRRSRESILKFLDDEQFSVSQQLTVILLYGHSVQSEIDGGEAAGFDPHATLAEAKKYAGIGDLSSVVSFFQSLEILTDRWKNRLQQAKKFHPDPQLRCLARYMIERYWLQAVSDYDLIGRVKLIITACLLVGSLSGNLVSNAQLFSKEIENSTENIDAILDGAYAADALTDLNLLHILSTEIQKIP